MGYKHNYRERIMARIGNRDCDYYFDTRMPIKTELTDTAVLLFLCVLHSGDFKETQELFDQVADDIEKTKQDSAPDYFKIKLLTSALEIYLRTIDKGRNSDYESFRDEIIAKLEQEIPRHLNPKKLFIHAMLNELTYCSETYSLCQDPPTENMQAIH